MNVIIYVMDSLRTDHVGAFGYDRNTTPVLDKLASEGVAFSNFYAQSGWTLPSGASLLCGQHPSRTGIKVMKDGLGEGLPWLPDVMKAEGFATCGVSSIGHISRLRRFDRGFDGFFEVYRDPETVKRYQELGRASRGSDYCIPLSEDLHPVALKWIDELREKDPYHPFAMLLWSIDTHEPFRQDAKYNTDVDPNYKGKIDGMGRPFQQVSNRADLEHVDALYNGSLRYQDEQLGHFVESLRERGILDETLLIIVGDHGEMFFEHGLAGHGKYPWEAEMRVPMVMRCPQCLPQGVRVDGITQMIDIPPTILDLAGRDPEPAFKGKTLRPFFDQGAKEVHEAIVLEVPFPFSPREHARVVRTPEWKLIEYTPAEFGRRWKKMWKEIGRFASVIARPKMLGILYGHILRRGPLYALAFLLLTPMRFLSGKTRYALYHMLKDPDEKSDMYRHEPAVVKSLLPWLQALDAQSTAKASQRSGDDDDAEAKIEAHLRALGYVED